METFWSPFQWKSPSFVPPPPITSYRSTWCAGGALSAATNHRWPPRCGEAGSVSAPTQVLVSLPSPAAAKGSAALLRMPTLQIPLDINQRYSGTRGSTCCPQIYYESLEERSHFVGCITKGFCGWSTCPRASDPREQRQPRQSTKSHLKNKLKQENRWSRINLFQTLCIICCSSAWERT